MKFLVKQLITNYIFRLDLKILISKHEDRYFVCENQTSVKFLEITFNIQDYGKIIDELSDYYNIDRQVIENDYYKLIDQILNSKNKKLKLSRGGIPEWMDYENIQYPISIEVELTKRCNWNCKFCYNVWKYSKKTSEYVDLPLDVYKKIVDESVDNGCTLIRLSGGEPTLHPNFEEIIRYTSQKELRIALFTNASLISERNIKLLSENNIETILISLHGTEKVHNAITGTQNSYTNTLKKINQLIENNISVSVETILLGNVTDEQLIQLSKILMDLGVENWNLMPYVATGAEYDEEYKFDFNRLPNLIKKLSQACTLNIRVVCSQKFCFFKNESEAYISEQKYLDSCCGAGVVWLSISYNGQIRNCPHSDIYAGKVEDGIKNIYLSKLKPKVNAILLNATGECLKCKMFDKCRGGCYLSRIEDYKL